METRSWMSWGGLGLLAFGAALHLVFGVAETVGEDDSGGWIHFVAAAILFVLLYFAIGHPFGVGLTLLALAAVLAVLPAILDELEWASSLLALPPLVSGALLVGASRQPTQRSMIRPPRA